MFTFALPDHVSFDEGAALPMNYLTAEFALHERGGLQPGETVLVHGAAGGLGTATIQVAKGMGARVIGVVSTEEKAEVARAAGADEAVLLDGFKDAVKELTGGIGVDVVADIVGGPRSWTRSGCSPPRAACSCSASRPARASPRSRSTGCCSTTSTCAASAGAPTRCCGPGYMQEQWKRLVPMMGEGREAADRRVYELEEFGQALIDMDERRTLGKSVVRVRD